MRSFLRFLTLAFVLGGLSIAGFSAEKLKREDSFFPLAVWLQSPHNAERFKSAGINTYVGLWKGPTEEQFNHLKAAGMRVVCEQNEFALAHKEDPLIIAWMHNDEPDNAQSRLHVVGYGPPIKPAKIIALHDEMRAKDPSHPILLNLGQGVARDDYIGRGVRRNHPEDYPEYVKGADIVSFDIYPVTNPEEAVKGRLELVANGVKRLKEWAGPEREVWNCVEARVGDENEHIAPAQLRAEVWMSIIHGSRGLIYFVHQFKPKFREASIFDDPDLLRAMTDVNKQITQLAPVLNKGEDLNVTVVTRPEKAPIATMAKKRVTEIYVFAVGMSAQPATATLKVSAAGSYDVELLGESRRFQISSGEIPISFNGYEAHVFKLTPAK